MATNQVRFLTLPSFRVHVIIQLLTNYKIYRVRYTIPDVLKQAFKNQKLLRNHELKNVHIRVEHINKFHQTNNIYYFS